MRKILLFCICAFVLCACGMLLSLRFASCKITKICNQLWSLHPKSVKDAITANLLLHTTTRIRGVSPVWAR